MTSKASTVNFAETNGEENEDSLRGPCFQIDPSVELKEIPTNGEEYLLQVIMERKKCKAVTKCKDDLSKFAKNQSCFAEGPPPVKIAPEGLKPTIEWQNIQVADFSETRMYISRIKSKKKSAWPKSVQKVNIIPKDCASWKEFLGHCPSLSLVVGLSQTLLNNGLNILVNSLNKVKAGDTIDQKTGQWIYSLLACIELPLLSDTISLLRDLARKCADIRSHIDAHSENAVLAAAPLNMFICLVSRYFRQFDLVD